MNANAKAATAQEGRVIIAIGAHAWGKGLTKREAKKNWRDAGPAFGFKQEVHVYYYDCPAKTRVDEVTGGFSYPQGEPEPKKIGEEAVVP